MGLPPTLPGMTNGLPSTRGSAASTSAASGDSAIVRGPTLVSGSRSSGASKSTSSHRRFRISPLRQPVSSSSRIAGTAEGNTDPSASASASTRPRRRYSSRVRNRSRRCSLYLRTERHGLRRGGVMPQPSASLNILARTPTVWLAWYGLSRIL